MKTTKSAVQKSAVTVIELSRILRIKPKALRRKLRNLPASVRGRHTSRSRYEFDASKIAVLKKELKAA
jgi:hypothetical protein